MELTKELEEHMQVMLRYAEQKRQEENMPIVKGHSRASVSKNVRQFYKDFRAKGHSKAKAMRMAQGAAFSTARTAAKRAGVRPSHLRK